MFCDLALSKNSMVAELIKPYNCGYILSHIALLFLSLLTKIKCRFDAPAQASYFWLMRHILFSKGEDVRKRLLLNGS